MIRNLKALGLALVAVFALGAMAAASASAYEGKITSTGPVTLDGTETTPGANKFTAFGNPKGTISCTESTITGHKTLTTAETATKSHELIPSGSTSATITLHPNNTHCTAIDPSGTHKATVTMNGCDFDVTITETLVANTSYSVDYRVVCPAGQRIEIHVYPFAGSELGGSVCTITVTETAAGVWLPGGSIEDTGEHLRARGTVTGIHAEREGSGCTTETVTNGEFHIDTTLTGTNVNGQTTALDLSHP